MKHTKSKSRPRYSAKRENERLLRERNQAKLEFLRLNVRPNNPKNPGWNRAEDLGVPSEKLPRRIHIGFYASLRDGKDSGVLVTHCLFKWFHH